MIVKDTALKSVIKTLKTKYIEKEEHIIGELRNRKVKLEIIVAESENHKR